MRAQADGGCARGGRRGQERPAPRRGAYYGVRWSLLLPKNQIEAAGLASFHRSLARPSNKPRDRRPSPTRKKKAIGKRKRCALGGGGCSRLGRSSVPIKDRGGKMGRIELAGLRRKPEGPISGADEDKQFPGTHAAGRPFGTRNNGPRSSRAVASASFSTAHACLLLPASEVCAEWGTRLSLNLIESNDHTSNG